MSSEPISETADADSRETVVRKEEGFDFKFSENPIIAWFLRGNPLLKTGIVVLFLGLRSSCAMPPSGFMCRWKCVIGP